MRCNLGEIFDRSSDLERVGLIDCRIWDAPRERMLAELDREASGVASGLRELGLRPPARIGILAENRSEYLTAFLGILRAGLTAVPISHRFPRATIDHVLRDAEVSLTFCDAQRRGRLPSSARFIDFDASGSDGFAAFLRDDPASAIVQMPGDAIAMILYTSGSTGLPKGVPLTHGGHRWVLDLRLKHLRGSAQQRLLVVAPLFHMNALCTSLFALAAGSSEVLLPRFEVRRFIEAIERFRCEAVTVVPTMMAMILRERELLRRTDFSSVRHVRMGSAPVSEKLFVEVQRLFPHAFVQNAYGTTEAGPAVFGPDPAGRPIPPGACGWPMPGIELRLVDEHGEDAAEEGELWMRSPANAPGYLNLPERTRSVFTEDGWYRSGDVFRRDELGAFRFVRRVDDMFVCGGENIHPTDVEATLERHPAVLQSCVVPVPDELKGEKPVAFVVLRPGARATEDEIKQFALANAPAHQHPRMVTFVDGLPAAGPGKIDRKGLRANALERWRERAAPTATAET